MSLVSEYKLHDSTNLQKLKRITYPNNTVNINVQKRSTLLLLITVG